MTGAASAIALNQVPVNGVGIHYATCGVGQPLLFLHGWPEFWLTWKPLMEILGDRFEIIAPDLRGFGRSGPPNPVLSDQAGADVHATDMLALLDTLGLTKIGILSHDVGSYVAQALARRAPERVTGLCFFSCPNPGIGARWSAPDHLKEIWYQTFNQLPWAAEMVGSSREACRLYIAHFLKHWSGRKDAFDDVLEAWVDNFMTHGNLQGGFNWYVSYNATRLAMMRGELPTLPPIGLPTRVLWGSADPVLKVEWSDKLSDTFTDLEFSVLDGLGHFPHREDPARVAEPVAAFFGRLAA